MNRIEDRDPRKDPQPGDVIDRHTCKWSIRRIVVGRNGSEVDYKVGIDGPVKNCWITTWQDWARHAEVIKTA